MRHNKMGAFTEKEREALKLATVLSALTSYREDRSPFNKHRLSSALVNAGFTNVREREAFITRLMRSRRYGDG